MVSPMSLFLWFECLICFSFSFISGSIMDTIAKTLSMQEEWDADPYVLHGSSGSSQASDLEVGSVIMLDDFPVSPPGVQGQKHLPTFGFESPRIPRHVNFGDIMASVKGVL